MLVHTHSSQTPNLSPIHSLTGPLPIRVAGGSQDVQAGVHVVAGARAEDAASSPVASPGLPHPFATAAADGPLGHRGGRVHARRVSEENPLVLNLQNRRTSWCMLSNKQTVFRRPHGKHKVIKYTGRYISACFLGFVTLQKLSFRICSLY